MRVLHDHNIDWRLSRELAPHEVSTARNLRWDQLLDSELLRRAAAEFDAFVTCDRGLPHQNDIASLPLVVVLLVPRRNRLDYLMPLVRELLAALDRAMPGEVIIISAP